MKRYNTDMTLQEELRALEEAKRCEDRDRMDIFAHTERRRNRMIEREEAEGWVCFFIALIVILACFTTSAKSQDIDHGRAECVPTIDAIDWRAKIEGDAGTLIWWCETAQGLKEYSRTGDKAAEVVMQLVGGLKYPERLLNNESFDRTEQGLGPNRIALLRRDYTPHCIAINNQLVDADGKPLNGRIAIGQQLGCSVKWIGEERYCHAYGAPLFSGDGLVKINEYVECEFLIAPAEGWISQ